MLKTLQHAGADGFSGSDIRRGICIGMNILCISIFLLNLIAGPVFYALTGKSQLFIGIYAEALLMLGVITLNYKRRYFVAGLLFYIVTNLSAFYFVAIFGAHGLAALLYLFILGGVFLLLVRVHTRWRGTESAHDPAEDLHTIKNNFFQHISHDIRGAYFGVGSICAVIHDKVCTGQPVTPELAETLLMASQNYKYMLNHFLEFSKFKMGTVDERNDQLIDVAAEVKQIVELNQYLAREKDLHVKIDVDEDFPSRLLTDRLKIDRIFYNIFVNALKFSSPGSRIEVGLEVGDDSWKLRVVDQGKGFQPDQLAHIFEPYATSRTPENPEGIGLGLYITNYLAKLLGGEIDILSSPGAGATVELRFPLGKFFPNASPR